MKNVVIGRLDNNERVQVEDNTTITAALNAHGYAKDESEEIQDIAGNKFSGSETVVNGGAYYLVQRVKSGC